MPKLTDNEVAHLETTIAKLRKRRQERMEITRVGREILRERLAADNNLDYLLEALPSLYSAGLRRRLVHWVIASWTQAVPDDTIGDAIRRLTQLVSAVPGVTKDPEDPIVRSALRLEKGLRESLPAWVPPLIGLAFARLTLWAVVTGESTTAIWRLASDSRMKAVWYELSRRRSTPNTTYLYPACVPRTSNEHINQNCAFVLLFARALSLYRSQARTMTTLDVDTTRELLTLKREATAPSSIALKWGDGKDFEYPIGYDFKSSIYVWSTDNEDELNLQYDLERILREPDLLIGRHRNTTKPGVQAFLIQLLQWNRRLFGTPLYGSAATIASVLFGEPVPHSLVRWCAKPHVIERVSKAHLANRAAADRFASRALSVIHEIKKKEGQVSLREIAAVLNARGIPTARGGKWHASTVRNLWARARQQTR